MHANTSNLEAEHQRLQMFVGTWKSEGEMKPSPLGPGGKFSATVRCESVQAGFFLLFRSTLNGPAGETTGLSIWGYDPDRNVYTNQSFGQNGKIRIETATVEGSDWPWMGEITIEGKTIKTRYLDKLISGDSLLMTGEISVEGGPWAIIMEGKATKIENP